MAELPTFVDPPAHGRSFVGERTVSLADVAPDGRMRFDSIARFLGDVANDDTDDAGLAEFGLAWVARRAAFLVERFPVSREHLTMRTWCSGTGARWAERRTSITGSEGAALEAVSLWIHLDPETGRPTPWGDAFATAYLEAAGGREVGSRLALPKRAPEPATAGQQWSFRRTDLDVFDHVNNAAYLAVVEEAYATSAPTVPLRLDIEWHRPTGAGRPLGLAELDDGGEHTWWLTDEATCAVMRIADLNRRPSPR